MTSITVGATVALIAKQHTTITMKQATLREYARLADKAFDNYLNGNLSDAKEYAKKPSKWFLMDHFNQYMELLDAKELAETLKN